jgi:hypothetical protein
VIGVALHAHDLAAFDMGDERAHVGTIVRTDNSNGLRHTRLPKNRKRSVTEA